MDVPVDRPVGADPGDSWVRNMMSAVIVAEGAALGLIVGWDGSALSRAGHVLIVLAMTVGAAWIGRRGGQVARGATILFMGMGGVVAGIGVGGVYLAKIGLSAMTIAGLVASITGIALLVSGSVSLTLDPRMVAGAGCSRRAWTARLRALPADRR